MKYTIVVNPNEGPVCIPHSDADVPDIMLGSYASMVIDPGVWGEDVETFQNALDDKAILLEMSDKRPAKIPKPPAGMPQVPLHAMAVRQIVFLQDEERALEYIRMYPIREQEAGQPADIGYLKTTHLPILRAALEWLESWKRRDRRSRVRAIKKRIEEIKLM